MNPSREEPSTMRPVLSVGRYSLFGELATGGMATVHFGRMHAVGGFNKTVAIKRMRRDIGMDPEFVAMFLDEARLTSRIEHPNVVATIDVVAQAGEVFLVLEYVRGESLERLRRAARARREPIPVPVALSIMCGTLAGLHAAHEAVGEDGVPLEIIHRDVSPQNILVGEDGVARISDFGIAKAESRLQVTHDGQMKGKLPYMAPEQLSGGGRRLDRRVDVFSAAIVLWELLAGRTLFRADHPGETIGKVLSAPVPSLCPLRADIPAALDRVVRQGLSRPPGERPPTAEAFAVLLEESVGSGLASPRAVGAWVSSLAAEVLESRLRYVREIESVSQLDAAHPDPVRGWLPGLAQGASAVPAGQSVSRPLPAVTAPPRDASKDQALPVQAPVPVAAPWLPSAVGTVPDPMLSSSPQQFAPQPGVDTTEWALQRSRTKRLVWVAVGVTVLLIVAVLLAIVVVFGGQPPGEDVRAVASAVPVADPLQVPSEPSFAPPPPSAPAVVSDSINSDTVPTTEPDAPSTSSPPVKATTTGVTKPPPVKGVPTRPYLPDMP